MSDDRVWVPMSQSFVTDLIRFSDGEFTPELIGYMAEEQLLNLFERSFDVIGEQWFGERAMEFADVYFPDLAEDWRKRMGVPASESKPLVWKGVNIPHGSDVRMQYGGEDHFAKVDNGAIADKTGRYTPSQWARKVARGTSRNAWRDLWFREPWSLTWVPADLMRKRDRS